MAIGYAQRWRAGRRPTAYLAGTGTGSGHYAQVAFWLLAMLLLATALAYAATWPPIRRAVSKLPLVGSFPHDSTTSAWWILFEKWRTMHEARVGGDVKLEVGCVLDNGAYVSGYLSSFNASADDSPDRDLILSLPSSTGRQVPRSRSHTSQPALSVSPPATSSQCSWAI